MNKSEREVVQTLYKCIEKIGSMYPSNPADISTLSKNFRIINGETRSLMAALFDLKIGDTETAKEWANDALTALSEKS